MQIKADGVAHFFHRGDGDDYYRAWFDTGGEYYRTSMLHFDTECEADTYGKRVADRFNRIFGEEAKDVQNQKG